MRGPTRRILTSLGVLLLVAACGGGGATSPDAGGGGSAASQDAGGTASQPPDGGAPSADAPSAAASTAAESPAGGGGSASDACGLATAAEIEGVFGVSGVTSQLVDGFPPTCDIQLESAPFMAIVLVDDPASSGPIYEAWAGDPAATTISGLGDRAVYAPSNAILVVQRGDRVASFALFDDGSRSEEQRIQLLTEVGKVAAGRL